MLILLKLDILQKAIDSLVRIKLIDARKKDDLLTRIKENENKYLLQKNNLQTLNQCLETIYEKNILNERDKNRMQDKLTEFFNMLSMI